MTDQPSTPPSRYSVLIEITNHLSRTIELDPFLHRVVLAACQGTDCEASSISLYEGETGLLRFVAAPENQAEQLKLIRVPLESSVAGECFTKKQPVVIQNAEQDPRIYRAVDQDLDFVTRSLAAVPILLSGEPIGVLEAINKLAGPYSQEDVRLLESLASLAAVAILNTQLMQDVRRYYQEVTDLEKMKNDFVAVSSHELRTPLGVILGHASQLKESLPDALTLDELDTIAENALRMERILDDLTSISESQSDQNGLRRNLVSLDQVIQNVVANFEEMAERNNVHIFTRLPEGPLKVYGDEEKLAIALGNLIKNAIVYNNENGKVWVVAERLPGYLKLSVLDTGIGIPTKDLGRVFDKFYQVEGHLTRKHSGMGLGLSVAKTMIEAHGGQIWAESMEGKGSNFSILLPTGLPQKPGNTGWLSADRVPVK